MIVDVVAGLIVANKRILVCQRDKRGVFPLKWEFPGGKVEQGESRSSALQRELEEELDIRVTSARQVLTQRHRYADHHCVDLTFFEVESYSGLPRNRVFHHMIWATADELETLDFLAGDLSVIEKIRQGALGLSGQV